MGARWLRASWSPRDTGCWSRSAPAVWVWRGVPSTGRTPITSSCSKRCGWPRGPKGRNAPTPEPGSGARHRSRHGRGVRRVAQLAAHHEERAERRAQRRDPGRPGRGREPRPCRGRLLEMGGGEVRTHLRGARARKCARGTCARTGRGPWPGARAGNLVTGRCVGEPARRLGPLGDSEVLALAATHARSGHVGAERQLVGSGHRVERRCRSVAVGPALGLDPVRVGAPSSPIQAGQARRRGQACVRDVGRGDLRGGGRWDGRLRHLERGVDGVGRQVGAVPWFARPGAERVEEEEPRRERSRDVHLAADVETGAHAAGLAQQRELGEHDPVADDGELTERVGALPGRAGRGSRCRRGRARRPVDRRRRRGRPRASSARAGPGPGSAVIRWAIRPMIWWWPAAAPSGTGRPSYGGAGRRCPCRCRRGP